MNFWETGKSCLMWKVHTTFLVPCLSIMKMPITADTKLTGRLVCCCFWRLSSLCMLGLTSVLCLLPFLTPWAQGPLEPSLSCICSPAISSYVPDLLFSAVARACAGSWLHANGLFMLPLFSLVYVFPLLSLFLFHFLWYGTNVPGCVGRLGWSEMAEKRVEGRGGRGLY